MNHHVGLDILEEGQHALGVVDVGLMVGGAVHTVAVALDVDGADSRVPGV